MQVVTVDGHLGRDAKIFTSSTGGEFIAFSIASNSRLKNIEKTTWYDVIIPSVERHRNLVPYLTKGKYVFVSGDLDVALVKDQNGADRLRLTISTTSVNFPSVKKGEGGNNTAPSQSAKKEEEIQVISKPDAPSPTVVATPIPVANDDSDEELPF